MLFILCLCGFSLCAARAPAKSRPNRQEKTTKSATSSVGQIVKPTFADVKYGPHKRNVLDFWQAKSDTTLRSSASLRSTSKPTPIAVYIHGGGFRRGDKNWIHRWYADVLDACLKNGVSVAAIHYRFLDSAALPDIFRDCARAVQFLRFNSARWNIDKARVAAFGASAGAGASMWLAFHDDIADHDNADPVLRESSRLTVIAGNNCQSTYDRQQWDEIVGKSPSGERTESWKSYGLKGPDEVDSQKGRKIRADVDLRNLITPDDAPVFLYCKYGKGEPTNHAQYIHHPRHSIAIKSKCDEVGVEAQMLLKADTPGLNSVTMHKPMLKFLFRHLKETSIPAQRNRQPESRQRTQREQRPRPTHPDEKYGEHEKQAFDLYLVDSDKPTPLFIWIHGGGFRGGDKRGVNAAMVQRFAQHGVSFASMNYRLTDVGPYPMQMLDAARGLQTIRHRAKRYNIDPSRIACGGSSAGAGISMWLLYHDDLAEPRSDDPVARQSTRIICAVSIGGQTSYDPRVIKKLFNTNQVHEALIALYRMKDDKDLDRPELTRLFEDASIINHATRDDPPLYLYYPQANEPLPPNSTGRQHIHHPKFGFLLKKETDKLGLEAVLKLREDFKSDNRNSPEIVRDQVDWVLKHFGIEAGPILRRTAKWEASR